MEGFNDLNDIIVFYMRKMKWLIAIIAAGCIVFAGMRCVDTLPSYLNQDKTSGNDTEQTESISEEPVYKSVDVLLRIEPTTEDGVDMTQYIVSSFVANKTNETVVNELMDQYLEAEKNDNKSNRELLYSYGYILDKERNYTYNETDFLSQLRVYACSENTPNNYVGIGFTSMNESRAKEVAEAYQKILTEEVKRQIGDFEYEVESEKVEYKLPTASAGASPTRVANTASASSNTSISFTDVLKDIIKGVVWGFLLGFVAGILILAVWYLTSKRVQKISDIRTYSDRVFGVCAKKRRLFSFWYKWIHNLEGEKRVFDKPQDLAEVILASMENKKIDGKIMVAGGADQKSINAIYHALSKDAHFDFIKGGFVLADAESIRNCQACSQVIIVEEIGKSMKEDIRREIDVYAGYGVRILGVAITE